MVTAKFNKYISSLKEPTKAEWLFCLLLFIVPFATMMDGDTKAFVHYEVNFWGSMFDDKGIWNFYEYSNEMLKYYRLNGIGGAFEVIYDFPVYVILGIWGAPLYLFCNLTGIEETSNMWTMLYGKSIYFAALAVTAFIIYKICINLEMSKTYAKWASFLFLSSAAVFVYIGMVGQLDILGFPFTLLGIYYFQKKSSWRFILFFAIAVTFKQFPLFVFLPLLLLCEKNVVKAIGKLVIVLGFTMLVGLPFPKGTEAMEIKAQIREQFLNSFLGCKLPLYNSNIPIVVVLIGIICVYCYLKRIETDEELRYYSIFIPAVSMFTLMVSFDSNVYWFVHLAPFFAILLVYNSNIYNYLILFETIGSVCLIISQYGSNYWIFDPEQGKGMMLEKIFGGSNNFIEMKTFAAYLRLDKFSGVLFAGFLVCMLTVLWLSRPGISKKCDDICIRKYALARLLCSAGVSYIPSFLYVVSLIFSNYGITKFF